MKRATVHASIFLGALALLLLVAANAEAQTSLAAAQVVGVENSQALAQNLSALGTALGRLRVTLSAPNPPQNLAVLSPHLRAVGNTLVAISSMMGTLEGRALAAAGVTPGLPSAGTPGLPNTGGGGTQYTR